MTNTIEIDFFRDLVRVARTMLVADGYTLSSSTSDDDVLYAWCHTRIRVPEARCRRIHKSKEFRLPDVEGLEQGLELLERKLAAGDSIRGHLTRETSNIDYHDRLLNDWRIHHLHLGTSLRPDGMVIGTRQLVFSIFLPSDVYLIQVMDHEFCDPELLEVVNANWPQLLRSFRLPLAPPIRSTGEIQATTRNAVGLARSLTEHKDGSPRVMLRGGKVKAPPRVVSMVTLHDGTVLAPSGGGFTSSGHSLRVQMHLRDWCDLLEQWEKIVRGEVDRLVESAKQRGIDVPPLLRFALEYDEGNRGWCAVSYELEAVVGLPTEYPDGTRSVASRDS